MEKALKLAILSITLVMFVSGCIDQATGAFLEGDAGCFPMWQCTGWEPCSLKDGKWVQTRSCNDVNGCDSDTNKPLNEQPCESPVRYDLEIGETLSQCDIDITVDSVTISKNISYFDNIGTENWLVSTSDDDFVVLHIDIINNFRNDIHTSFQHFKLEDQNRRTYKPQCPTNDFDDCVEGGDWYFGSKYIIPSEKNDGYIIFYVPDTTSEINLLYEMPYIAYDCDGVETIYWKIK